MTRQILLATTAILAATLANAQPATTATITPGKGSIVSGGNTWDITASGSIRENGNYTPGGGGTSALTIGPDGTVYGQDNGHDGNTVNSGGWFTLDSAGQNWAKSAPPTDTAQLASPNTAQPSPSLPPIQQAPQDVQLNYACSGAVPNSDPRHGGFATINGQIYHPDGTPFVARGVNVYSFDLASISSGLDSALPGTNFIRVITRPLQDPSTYTAFVNQMTARGIVVEFEDHPNGGGGQDAGPPQGIAAESAWYAAMAAAYKNNPYVWFGTFNEPAATANLSAWHKATYDAIRGAGNTAPILIEPGGSRPWNLTSALDPAVYAGMENIIMDPHAYNYQSDYSTDQATVDASVKAIITAAQAIKSIDGVVPVIIGEYGNSTTGTVVSDPGGMQEVKAVESSGIGSVAYTWTSGIAPGNMLRNDDGSLTDYGRATAAFDGATQAPSCNISPIPSIEPKPASPGQALVPQTSLAGIKPPPGMGQ